MQVAKYVDLLLDAGKIARPGPEINPETVYVPQLSGGYWFSIFNADQWTSYADPSERVPLLSASTGLIFYASVSNPSCTPLPLPAFQPVKVAKPGNLPGFASYTSCAQLNSKLAGAGLLGLGLAASGPLVDWAVVGGFLSGAGRWLRGLIETEVAEQIYVVRVAAYEHHHRDGSRHPGAISAPAVRGRTLGATCRECRPAQDAGSPLEPHRGRARL